MPFKPNYRFDRAARARSKEAKKIETLEAQAARRQAIRDESASPPEAPIQARPESQDETAGLDCPREKEE